MITNVANITFDSNNIKKVTQNSNVVKIDVCNIILNICITEDINFNIINICNNTGQNIKCLKIQDFNNNFIYKQELLNKNSFKKVKYQKKITSKILISYIEKNNNKVYIINY